MGDYSASKGGGVLKKRADCANGSGLSNSHDAEASESTRLLGADVEPRKDSWTGSDDFEGLPWWRRPSIYWLLPPYLLYTLAFGGIIVPKLNLILDLVCRKYFADQTAINPNFTFAPVLLGGENPQCQIAPIQKIVAKFTLVLNLVVGLLSAIIAPKLGHLSDRYGRTKWLGLSSLGGIIFEIITILAAKYPDTVDYRWIILGAFFDGLAGSFTAGSLLSHSYASDCTPPSKRGIAIGYLHACLFSGLAFGPLVATQLIKKTHSLLSIFYIVLACHIIFVLFISFAIPESLSKARQLASREKHAKEKEQRDPKLSWIESFRHRNPLSPLKILLPSGPGASSKLRRNLVAMAIVDMVVLGAAMGGSTVIILYSGYIFKWKTAESSMFVSVVSMVRTGVLLGVFPIINYFLRVRPAQRQRAKNPGQVLVEKNAGCDGVDIWLIRSGLLSDVIGVIGYAFARTPGTFYLGGIITAFGGLGSATAQAALTKHVPNEMVGQLLGAVGLLHGLARVVAPMAFNGLYYMTVETFPQAIFILLACLFSASLVASFFIRPHVYLATVDGDAEETDNVNETFEEDPEETGSVNEAFEEDPEELLI